MKTKTIPVSEDVHKLLKFASLNYGVTIQEAANKLVMEGAKVMELQMPKLKSSKAEQFWALAEPISENLVENKTNSMDAINSAIQEVRSERATKKKK